MTAVYITEQGATLTKTDGRIVVRKDRKVLLDIPAFKVKQVVIFGNAHLTTPAVDFCLKSGIDVAYLSSRGKYRGRLQPEFCKDAGLRQAQYRRSLESEFCLEVAHRIVSGKIRNSLTFCRRQERRRDREIDSPLQAIERSLHQVALARDLDSTRGYEGIASTAHYRILRDCLKGSWRFEARIARPPTDPINILLSLGYTLLYNNVYGAINIVGLDPYQGFFHQTRHGHATLASDLMEEFRAIIVDSIVLYAINRDVLTPQDFSGKEGEAPHLSQEGLEKFLGLYANRINAEVIYPQQKVRTSYLRCLELQVRYFARVILGENKGYTPFKVR